MTATLRLLRAVTLTATLLCAVSSPAQATAANVVPNPGFEQAGCGNTPIFCGWLSSGWMGPDTTNPHSGAVSMAMQTCVGACNADDSWTAESASTDPAACATIGPGTHPASFWSVGGNELARLSATFYAQPDCTSALGSDSLQQLSASGELAGDLVAPPGTQSALFSLDVGGHGVAFGEFDDLEVENTVVTDSIAPQTTIVCPPELTSTSCDELQPSWASWASFYFDATEQSTFECSLDDAAYTACSSPANYLGLSAGSHTFRVRATDRVSNTDPTPAEQTWTTPPDTTPPETTITSGPSGTTASSSATFEFGSNDEPSTFACSLDGGAFAACSSPENYVGLGQGSHSFRVRATDAAGNTDPTPAEQTWTVHTNVPPAAAFTYNCAASTCSFDGTASSDSDGTIQSYVWNFGDGTSGSGATTTHSYMLPGAYVVTLTVTDNSGATAAGSKSLTLISLHASGYKQRGLDKVDLTWSGAAGASFDVYRNGSKIATVQAGAYTDTLNTKASGTYAYKVCAASICSNTASVTF